MTEPSFQIDGHLVGGESVFVIAEIGNNHNGSMALAQQLVDEAIKAGADCVKFQLRNRKTLYRSRANGAIAEVVLDDLLAEALVAIFVFIVLTPI